MEAERVWEKEEGLGGFPRRSPREEEEELESPRGSGVPGAPFGLPLPQENLSRTGTD